MCPYLEKKVKGITEMKDFIQRAEGSYRYVAAPIPNPNPNKIEIIKINKKLIFKS